MDVEKEFVEAIKKIEGKRVSEYVANASEAANADFIFPKYKVIAELKCLDTDIKNSEAAIEKASKIYLEALEEKSTPIVIFGTVEITTSSFTEQKQKEFLSIYRNPIQRLANKASAQINEIKNKLNNESYAGLLILANNNHTALEPANAHALIENVLSQPMYSGINSVVYLTANQKVSHPKTGSNVSVWIEIHRSLLAIPRINQDFLNELREAWYSHISEQTGKPILATGKINKILLSQLDNENKT